MAADELVVHGAREHNLKDVTVRLPRSALICITGLSGSGKSSLAFDTIYAEGQRRYVESLSAYARQFLQMMEKPDVDSIDGLSPAISIDQKTTSRNPRSTVGTVTEIYDYLRLLYARIGQPHCPICGRPIAGQSIDSIVEQILALPEGTRFTVNAPVVRDRKGEFRELFEELRNEGFTRVKVDGEQHLLEEVPALDKKLKHTIEVVVDRLVLKEDLRLRLTQSVETALALAEGLVTVGPRRHGREPHLLGAVRVPRARRLAARAPAADLLVQLAARRVPALHRARLAAGDRPRPARPGAGALDRRRRARPVGGRQLGLLRVGDPGDRGAVRDRRRQAVARALRAAAGLLPLRHEGRPGLRQLPQPDGPAALVHAELRGHRPLARAALPRDGQLLAARADRGVHVVPAVPRLQGRAAQARGARGHGRRPQHPRVHAHVGDARARLPRRARADRDRVADRRADREGDPRAAHVPRQRRRRLPPARPRVGDALGRRGAAAPARDADRLAARRRALHPRRAVDRPAPARQRPADRHARAAPRPRQHRDRGRARRADDAERRLARRHGPGRGRARRPRRRRGHGGEGAAEREVGHRPVPLRQARDRRPRASHRGPRRVRRPRRRAAQPEGDRRRVPGRQVRRGHGRLRLRQVDARERDRLQGAREPAATGCASSRASTSRWRGSTSSTR